MSDEPEEISDNPEDYTLPDGTCCLPYIHDHVDSNPLLLSLLHLVVFVSGSDKEIVNQEAAGNIMDVVADYMGRLSASEVDKLKKDMDRQLALCAEDGWDKNALEILRSFLDDIGAGAG